jgi:hypothetical protein
MPTPNSCPDCGWEFESPDPAREDEMHQRTLQHQAALLGAAGRQLMADVRVERDRFLRALGIG